MEFLELFFKKMEGKTISVAESVTGGMFASIITSQPNASKIFVGGVVVYSNESKQKILNIKSKDGYVNNLIAEEMSLSVNKLISSDISISFTGNAGPIPMERKPIGTTYIGITYKNETKSYKFISTQKDRNKIILETVAYGLKKIIEIL